jgi:hypothetical protein
MDLVLDNIILYFLSLFCIIEMIFRQNYFLFKLSIFLLYFYLQLNLFFLLIMMNWSFFDLIKQSIHLINQTWFQTIHWYLAFRLLMYNLSIQRIELFIALWAYQETFTLHIATFVIFTANLYFYWRLHFVFHCLIIWYRYFSFFFYFHYFLLY